MKTYSVQQVVNVPNSTSTRLIEAAANRVGLVVNAPSSVGFTLSILGTAVQNQGITLYPTNPPLVLTIETHGELVLRAWAAITSGTQNVTVTSIYRQ
jgi:hypothetical protein